MIFVSNEMLEAIKSTRQTLIVALEYVEDNPQHDTVPGYEFMLGSIDASARDLRWIIEMMEVDKDERK